MSFEHKSCLLIPLPMPRNANRLSFTDHTKETMGGSFAHRARSRCPSCRGEMDFHQKIARLKLSVGLHHAAFVSTLGEKKKKTLLTSPQLDRSRGGKVRILFYDERNVKRTLKQHAGVGLLNRPATISF